MILRIKLWSSHIQSFSMIYNISNFCYWIINHANFVRTGQRIATASSVGGDACVLRRVNQVDMTFSKLKFRRSRRSKKVGRRVLLFHYFDSIEFHLPLDMLDKRLLFRKPLIFITMMLIRHEIFVPDTWLLGRTLSLVSKIEIIGTFHGLWTLIIINSIDVFHVGNWGFPRSVKNSGWAMNVFKVF